MGSSKGRGKQPIHFIAGHLVVKCITVGFVDFEMPFFNS